MLRKSMLDVVIVARPIIPTLTLMAMITFIIKEVQKFLHLTEEQDKGQEKEGELCAPTAWCMYTEHCSGKPWMWVVECNSRDTATLLRRQASLHLPLEIHGY